MGGRKAVREGGRKNPQTANPRWSRVRSMGLHFPALPAAHGCDFRFWPRLFSGFSPALFGQGNCHWPKSPFIGLDPVSQHAPRHQSTTSARSPAPFPVLGNPIGRRPHSLNGTPFPSSSRAVNSKLPVVAPPLPVCHNPIGGRPQSVNGTAFPSTPRGTGRELPVVAPPLFGFGEMPLADTSRIPTDWDSASQNSSRRGTILPVTAPPLFRS